MSEDAPRLFLITPVVTDAAAFAPLFEAALEAAEMSCVLLRLRARDDGEAKKIVRALAPLAQQRGAACLVADDPQLAARADADGVHIEATGEALGEALDALKPERIVGAGGLVTRDDAMTAGEAGVDYVMFGGAGADEPHDAIVARVSWWAEIFNVPCVGYAHTLAGVADLARAGADFVALADAVWLDPRGVADALRDAALALRPAREPAQ